MVARSYRVSTPVEQRALYDDWAVSYERDLCAMGIRSPFMISAVFAHFVPLGTSPILDVGCGTGLQAEAISLLGYGPIIGIDISEQMLNAARAKGIYRELHRMTLGETLGLCRRELQCTALQRCAHTRTRTFGSILLI